jgi:PTS system cellobiose-specific IIC component
MEDSVMTGLLNRYVVPWLTALSENTYLSAIRAGMVSVVPLTIIGGFFMIVTELPVPGWEATVKPYQYLLQIPIRATFGLLAVFVCFAIGYELGKLLKQEPIVSATMAALVFFMIQIKPQAEYVITLRQSELASLDHAIVESLEEDNEISLDAGNLARLESVLVTKDEGATFPTKGLGSQGLFTAIIIALVSVRVQKFFTDSNLVIRMPQNVPPVVYESFLSLSPLFFLILFFWLIRFVLGFDINLAIQTIFAPLVFALSTLPGILVYALLVTMLWSVGINGDNALDAIVFPIFLQYLTANVEAASQGQPLPYITAQGFFTTFVNVGGTGATIGLALVLWNSREPGYRKVSRLSLPTQVFQINEPIFFGIPIVLNPIFMVPYIVSALLLTTCTYVLMSWGIIQRPFVNVPWTTPPVIGHYLVTGGDWKAAVWGAVSIALAMLVYYPFAKIAERQRLRGEATGNSRE